MESKTTFRPETLAPIYLEKAFSALAQAEKWQQEVVRLEDEELARVRQRRQRPSSLAGRRTPDWFYVSAGLSEDPVYKRAVAQRTSFRNEASLYFQAAEAAKSL